MAKAMRDNGKAIQRLREVGLRPTRQRVELASVLFKGEDRHVTAESLYEEASGLGLRISLATVYNTLHQFTHAGLLRQVIVDAARGYFDTNTGDHQHFFLEDEGALIDNVTLSGTASALRIQAVPEPGSLALAGAALVLLSVAGLGRRAGPTVRIR